MTKRAGPIYEVTLFVESDVVAGCDQWLQEHLREALHFPGVTDCHVFPVTTDNGNRAGRKCQHVLDGDEALDDYLEQVVPGMEADLSRHFGDKVEFRDRVFRVDNTHDLPPGESPNCLNCGTHLRGQYCGNCGQRSRSRVIRLWELISEAFGDLFEVDSRLWRTIVPLVTRPGQLTYDYLQGRRARYMPPFRMYLVLSLVFFVIAFFDPREELSLLFEAPSQQQAATETQDKDSGIVVFNDNEGNVIEDDCEFDVSDVEGMPGFLARRFTAERLRQVCAQIIADEGKSLIEKVVSNVPTALIVLLPLMALVLKALYPLSRRYYVEHLLFFVHLHAFFFLILTLQILFARLATAVRTPDLAITLVLVASSVYVPIYLFIAMRRVYGQNRFFTFLKFAVLTFAYFVGFSSIMAVTFTLAAFSI